MEQENAAAAALRNLGFNQLEAEVYVFLLSNPPMTAYRIAQHIAKPTANVYKAAEALARKGAIVLEEGESRVCRAVPVPQFRKRAERDYRAALQSAADALDHLEPPATDERVYRVESASQVFELAREMIGARVKKVAVIDAFPAALDRIADSVRAAARRGVNVFVEAYRPVEIPKASVVHAAVSVAATEHWRSEQLNVVIDGREHLIALLSRDLETVYQAVWSNSLYLSCIQHAGRLCEHTLVRMVAAADAGATPAEVVQILREHRFFVSADVPGQKELMDRFVESSETRPAGKRRGSRVQRISTGPQPVK